jgi:hypothetical protein
LFPQPARHFGGRLEGVAAGQTPSPPRGEPQQFSAVVEQGWVGEQALCLLHQARVSDFPGGKESVEECLEGTILRLDKRLSPFVTLHERQ